MKFGQISSMISLGKLDTGKILHVGQVGSITNILLETSTASCQRAYVLVSLGQNRLSADKWEIKNNCRDMLARVIFNNGEEYFDFVGEKTVTRYTYRDGGLLRSKPVALPTPKTTPASVPPVATRRSGNRTQSPLPRPKSPPTVSSTPSSPPQPSTSPVKPSVPPVATIPPSVSPSPSSLPSQTPSPTASPSVSQVSKPDDKVVLPDNIDFGKPVEQKKVTIDLS
jgi:hypothetical protein